MGALKFWIVSAFSGMFLTLAIVVFQSSASAALVWQNVRPTVATRGIATDGSLYVSAAENGIFTSTDLKNWTRASLPANAGQSYNDVIWSAAGKEFVAVGLGSLVTSPDGSTWTAGYTDTSGLGVRLQSVIYANSTYMAVGTDSQGAVTLVSTDGVNWQLQVAASAPSGGSLEFDGVTWGNGLYVAIGFSMQPSGAGADVLYTSPDGSHWAAQTLPNNGQDGFNGDGGNDAAFANNTFTVGGSLGVYTSSDGINWTAEFLPSPTSNESWIFGRLQAINGKFYAVGVDEGNTNYPGIELAVFSSADGSTWGMIALNQIVPTPLYWNLDAITTGGPGYVVAGNVGVGTSVDASSWTFQPSSMPPILGSCAYFDHGVAIVLGDHYAVTSGDGIHWSAPALSGFGGVAGGQGCIAANGTLFVTTSDLLAFSSDGSTWTSGAGAPSFANGITYQGNEFFALANQSLAAPWEFGSSDGKTWSAVSETGLPSDAIIGTMGSAAVTAGGGNVITWGRHSSNGQLFMAVSSNGSQWTVASTLPNALAQIAGVGFGSGTYVGIGNDASGNTMLMTSTDALHWSQISNLPAGTKGIQWGNVSYGGNTWLIPGVGGDVPGMAVALVSPDGKNWSLQDLGVGALAASNSAWVGSGFVVATYNDILFAPVSASGGGGSGGGGGGGSGGGGSSGGGSGGGGAASVLALAFLGLLAGLRRKRTQLHCTR